MFISGCTVLKKCAARQAKILLHGVFEGYLPGYVPPHFAVISDSVPRHPSVPVVPYMVTLGDNHTQVGDLRQELGIAPGAKVFCRHGGRGKDPGLYISTYTSIDICIYLFGCVCMCT